MEYPRMVPGIMLVSSQDGYVVEGGPSRDLFTGPVVLDLVPRLLPLLDGARAVEEIAAVLGPADEIAAVVRALARSGVVEVLDAPPGIVDDPPSPLRSYLRRSIPGGRGEIIYRRLQAASALVTGEGQRPDRIADLLARSGVGVVARRPASACWGAGNGASPDRSLKSFARTRTTGRSRTAPRRRRCCRSGSATRRSRWGPWSTCRAAAAASAVWQRDPRTPGSSPTLTGRRPVPWQVSRSALLCAISAVTGRPGYGAPRSQCGRTTASSGSSRSRASRAAPPAAVPASG